MERTAWPGLFFPPTRMAVDFAALLVEVAGMGRLRAIAHCQIELERLVNDASPALNTEFSDRLRAEREAWEAEGRALPFWVALLVMRKLATQTDSLTAKG